MSKIAPDDALGKIPDSLRQPLLDEYRSIVANFLEKRWSPSELSGGKFCEIVYSILHGYASGTYPSGPSKPRDFVSACRSLEQNKSVPRSFQILIPRILPALYEVRNNRGVGHVGGDVDPNQMDATFVLSNAAWVMSELIRVFHELDISEAQNLVDKLVELKSPVVWEGDGVRRVLDIKLKQKEQILVLLASSRCATVRDIMDWTEVKNIAYFRKTLRAMHSERLLELNERTGTIRLLPPGSELVSGILLRATK